jgi:hypothetical protein
MVVPILVSAVGAVISHVVTKGAKDKETEEKLELVKSLAQLTPEQAQAVDAVKKQSVDEMRVRVRLGIGPFKPLPEQASARAQELRTQKIAERGVSTPGSIHLTAEEKAAVLGSTDKKAAIDQLVDKKLAEMQSPGTPVSETPIQSPMASAETPISNGQYRTIYGNGRA